MTDEIKPMDVGDKGMRPDTEAPTVTALLPDTAVAGDPKDILLTVEGTNFHPRSTITFNGLDERTTFLDATHLSTGVKPSLFVVPAVCPVAVRNDGFPESNAMDFTFTEAGAPAAAAAGRKAKADDDEDEPHKRRSSR